MGSCAIADSAEVRRHVKIRGEANPYHPAYREYFKDRIALQRRRHNYDRLFSASTALERALIWE